jgi:hypothetical protein
VDLIARRFRGVLIAIVVLGLSAGAVFAGHVVLQATATAPTASEQGDQNEDADATDNEAPDGTEDGSGDAAASHGALVSQAAQMDAPVAALGEDGFRNHGEFVSCVAHMKDFVLPAEFDSTKAFLEQLKPSDCTTTDEDATEDATESDATNHGALVSEAAQMATPVNTSTAPEAKQFANHGEFVSCVARMKDVVLPTGMTSTTFLSTLTPEACGVAATSENADKADKAANSDKVHGKSGQHGKGRSHKRS